MGLLDAFRDVARQEVREVRAEEFPRTFGALTAATNTDTFLSPDYGGTNPHALYDFRVLEVDNRSSTATVTVTVNGQLTYRIAAASSKTIAPNGRIQYYRVNPSANLSANELEIIERGARYVD